MFKLFKRAEPVAKPSKPAQARGAAPAAAVPVRRHGAVDRAPIAPLPTSTMEVREDDDESAWDLWEQSNFQLDSQMGGLSPSDSVRVRDDRPSQAADLDDPFARVGKHHR